MEGEEKKLQEKWWVAALALLAICIVLFYGWRTAKQDRLPPPERRAAAVGGSNSKSISIKGRNIEISIADEPAEWVKGLQEVSSLTEGRGMLFLFPKAEERIFWNKDVLIPLDIIWIREGKVAGTDFLPPEVEGGIALAKSPGAVSAVLEISGGLAAKVGIKTGDKVEY
ncbi:MAG: DUF192 domain-containing protein [Patescibacteria group bacterium]